VHDVSGRTVRTLVAGRVAAGRHVQQWDGRADRGDSAPAGVYFVRLQSAAATKTQRVTLLR
jgi:flagellar hook assembly protein FlgD